MQPAVINTLHATDKSTIAGAAWAIHAAAASDAGPATPIVQAPTALHQPCDITKAIKQAANSMETCDKTNCHAALR
jgi:hypothetical protein